MSHFTPSIFSNPFRVYIIPTPDTFTTAFSNSVHIPYAICVGPRSRQSSVDGASMNTEEVYRSLRKTTAEIQNYSFETKLGRDTNSKDSGISQMDDQNAAAGAANELVKQQQQQHQQQQHQQQIQQHQHQLQYFAMNQGQYNSNGYNGHILSSIDKEDSCNGSKTQSTTTTESNTPENTVRLDAEMSARNSFTAKHSSNVTFLANGELVTECKLTP